MYLYEIVNTIDQKRYVGISINIKRRWREHRGKLNSGKHNNPHLQNAWNLHGKDVFLFKILNNYNNLEEI